MMRLPLGCTTHQFTLCLLLYGHTYLSRAHTTVQLLTMFKGSQNVAPRAYVRLTLGLVLYEHTYLSRSHTTVQCMTMLRGTVDGKKFAIFIHTVRHATIPVKHPLSPSHSMLVRTTTQNARVCEQCKFRKAACCTYTPTLDIGARGLSYHCACEAK